MNNNQDNDNLFDRIDDFADDGDTTGDDTESNTDDDTESDEEVEMDEAFIADENIDRPNPHNAADNDFFRLMTVGQQFVQLVAHYLAHVNRPPRNHLFIPDIRFNLQLYDDASCLRYFRFERAEIQTIAVLLRMPEVFKADNGSTFLSLEGLCLVLRRLAYPCRFCDLVHMFGRSESMLSRMVSTVLKWIYDRWYHHLLYWDHQRLTPAKLEQFAAAIHEQGSPLPGVIGFIDGTIRPIARPTEGQELDYNGHHRLHALKYQAVTSPDGIIIHLAGPYQGRHHDIPLYRASRLEQALHRWAKDSNGNQFYIYGDPAYRVSSVMQAPYPTVGITPRQAIFNERMSRVRVAVEWSFSQTLQYFAFSDFKKSQKSLMSAVHLHYVVSVILSNIHSCITGNNASIGRFGIEPPTLEEYLHG